MGVDSVRVAGAKFEVGDSVEITSGPMEGFTGTVSESDNERRKLTVMVAMFGRETPAEVDFGQVKKL